MLRSVYDQINVHVRGLAVLKIKSDECGFMLVVCKNVLMRMHCYASIRVVVTSCSSPSGILQWR